MTIFSSLRLFGTTGSNGPVGLPIVTNNRLWLRADKGIVLNGGAVQTWQDQSGNNYNFTNGTSGQQPTYNATILYGKPGLVFDGTDDWLGSSALLSNIITNSAYTLFTVFSVASVNTSNSISYSNDGIICDGGGYWGTYVSSNGPRVIGFHWDGSDDHVDTGIMLNHTYAMVQQFDGSNIHTRIARIEIRNSVPSGNVQNVNGSLRMGLGFQAGNYFHGVIHEVICYNDFKSESDVGTIFDYLVNFWSLGLPVEDSTPYSNELLYEFRSDRYISAANYKVADAGDLTQANSTYQPTLAIEQNGMHTLQFGGYMEAPFWTANQPMTIYLVGKATGSFGSVGTFIQSENDSLYVNVGDNTVTGTAAGGPIVSLQLDSGGFSGEALSELGALNWGTTRVASIVFNDFMGRAEAYINNNVATFCRTGSAGSASLDGALIGATSSSSNLLNGEVKCIMVYDGAHDEEKRKEIMDFLNARYSIAYYGFPQALPWGGWWRGSYEGVDGGYEWPPTLSAKGSGYTLSADGMFAIAPDAGPGVTVNDGMDEITSALFEEGNVLQTGAELSNFFGDGSKGSIAILFKSDFDNGSGTAYTETPLLFDNINFSFGVTIASSGAGVSLQIDTENEGVHAVVSAPFTSSEWNLAQFKWGDGNMYARVNSGSWDSVLSTGIANTTGTLDIGYSVPNAVGFNGEILEVMVGDFFAADEVFDALVEYVNERYELNL